MMVNIDGIVVDISRRWDGEPSRRESEVIGIAVSIISNLSGVSLLELFSPLLNRTGSSANVVSRAVLRYLQISGDRYAKTEFLAYANFIQILAETIAETNGLEMPPLSDEIRAYRETISND